MTLLSIARPYARAAFACALEEGKLGIWTNLLAQAVQFVREGTVQRVLHDPRSNKTPVFECLSAIGESLGCIAGGNFLRLLGLNRRLQVLPEIERLFEQYRAKQSGEIKAQAISAVALTKAEKQTLASRLAHRFQQQVKLDYQIDKRLLGGIVVRIAEDWVMDNSIRNKLERLRSLLVD